MLTDIFRTPIPNELAGLQGDITLLGYTKKQKNQNLKLLDGMLAAVIVLPFVYFAVDSQIIWNSTVAEVNNDLTWRAEVASEHVARLIESDNFLLRRMDEITYGLSDDFITTHENQFNRELQDLQTGVPRVKRLFILNASGQPLAWASPEPVPKVSVADRDYFHKAASSETPSLIVSGRWTGGGLLEPEPVLDIALRRKSPNGTFVGAVVVAVSLNSMDSGYLETRLALADDEIAIGLFRNDGTVIFRTPQVITNQHISPQMAALVSSGASAGQVIATIDNLRREGVFRRVGNASVYIYASIPWRIIQRKWVENFFHHLVFGVPAYVWLIYMVSMTTNRTKSAHAAALRANEEQERRNAAERAAAAGQRMEALGRLAGGVAHDFNNALSVMLGHAEIAQKNPQHVPRALQAILTAGQRASRMVGHLLTFSHRKHIAPSVIDVGKEIERIVSTIMSMTPSSGRPLNIQTSISETTMHVLVDVTELDMALFNLIWNAYDATQIETGPICIFVTEIWNDVGQRFARVELSDSGVGMSAETLRHAFEPFFTTKPMDRSGMGLPQVLGFARQSGGTLEIFSSGIGMGTTVTMILPVIESDQDDGGQSS